LAKELVKEFGKNQETLKVLIAKVTHESTTNLDFVAQRKLRELRRTILIEDLKGQEQKIEIITKVLDEICSPVKLPTG
jgi:hypothetical protein